MFEEFNKGQKLTVIVFALANFCSAICVSLQAPFFPKEAEKKGATPSEYGFVFGVYELIIFLASPILGQNMNKLGAKRVFITGIFTTSTCSIMFGLLDKVPDGTAFISLSFLVRSIEACGNACFLTASFSIIAKEFPDRVSTMFACLETCFGLGLIVGPSVGGALYQFGGYTLPFVTLGGLLLCAACVTCCVLPSSYNIAVETDPKDKGWIAILKVPPIALATYSVICASLSLGFLQATLEPHLRQFDLAPFALGAMFIIQGGMYAITAPIWGWLCDRVIDPRMATAIGSLFITITFIFLGPVPFIPFESRLEVCIATLVIHGIGFSAVLVSAFGMAHREVVAHGFPDSLTTYALISALWTATFALGACIGPSVAGVLVDNFGFGWASLFVVISEFSVFIVTSSFFGYRWCRRRRYAKGYERLTPHREAGGVSRRGYEPIPSSSCDATPANKTKQVVAKTNRLYSPFISPVDRSLLYLNSNADAIVVDETDDGHLAPRLPSTSTTASKSKKGKNKKRRPGTIVHIEDRDDLNI